MCSLNGCEPSLSGYIQSILCVYSGVQGFFFFSCLNEKPIASTKEFQNVRFWLKTTASGEFPWNAQLSPAPDFSRPRVPFSSCSPVSSPHLLLETQPSDCQECK